MAKYFNVTWGLRGCYMPDGGYVGAARTRRQVKESIEDLARVLDSGNTQGFSKRAIAAFAATCWRESHKKAPGYLPYALPYKEPDESGYHNAIFISVATRREYLDHVKGEAD